VLGAAVASAVPLFRDLILPIVDGARYLALAAILGAAAVVAISLVDPRAVGVAALMLLVGTVSAAIGCSPMARVRSPHRVENRPTWTPARPR